MLFLDATFLTKKGVFCLHFYRKTSDFLGKRPKKSCARYVHTPKMACKDIPWKKYNPRDPQKVPKKWRKVQKTVYIFALFTPLFPQVLHTPPLIFRKHRRFRGARKRGSGAPKPPPGASRGYPRGPGRGTPGGVPDLNRGYPPKGGGTPKGMTPQRGVWTTSQNGGTPFWVPSGPNLPS